MTESNIILLIILTSLLLGVGLTWGITQVILNHFESKSLLRQEEQMMKKYHKKHKKGNRYE